jgi:hypothetical protein
MPRTVAATLLQNMLSPNPTDGIRWLADIDWNDGVNVGAQHLALHDQLVPSNGTDYQAASFGVGLPDENDDDVSMLRFVVQDPERALVKELRKLDPRWPAAISVKPMLLSNPNTAAMAPFEGKLLNTKFGRVTVSGSVETFKNMTNKPAVAYAMNPAYGFNALAA